MIAFDMDSTDWATASATVSLDGLADPPLVLTFPAGTVNLYVAMAWALAQLNANLGSVGTWSLQWLDTIDGFGTVSPRFVYDDGASGTFTTAVNAAWYNVTGLEADNNLLSWNSGFPGLGAWRPSLGFDVRAAGYRLADDGDCGSGASLVRPEAPGLSLARPQVRCVATFARVQTLGLMLVGAMSPRYAWIYQDGMATWTRVAVGEISRERDGSFYRLTFEAATEV